MFKQAPAKKGRATGVELASYLQKGMMLGPGEENTNTHTLAKSVLISNGRIHDMVIELASGCPFFGCVSCESALLGDPLLLDLRAGQASLRLWSFSLSFSACLRTRNGLATHSPLARPQAKQDGQEAREKEGRQEQVAQEAFASGEL